MAPCLASQTSWTRWRGRRRRRGVGCWGARRRARWTACARSPLAPPRRRTRRAAAACRPSLMPPSELVPGCQDPHLNAILDPSGQVSSLPPPEVRSRRLSAGFGTDFSILFFSSVKERNHIGPRVEIGNRAFLLVLQTSRFLNP